MTSALDKMLARSGKTRADFNATSRLGKILRSKGVQKTAELERIVAIPRRAELSEATSLDEVIRLIRDTYGMPSGTMNVRALQAVSLVELNDHRGLLAPQRVGAGKTLTTYLAPSVIEAKRPLLLVPAKLKSKTITEFAALKKHWQPPRNLKILSYEILGREDGDKLLTDANPDLIIADECQRLKNLRAAVTRRVKRWMDNHPETVMVALSGTLTTRSLKDYAHLAAWCLPNHAPVPQRYNELMEWSQAVDRKLAEGVERLQPGALEVLYGPAERELAANGETLAAVRTAYRKRLVETPGVVATADGPFADCSLGIEGIVLETKSQDVLDAVAKARVDFELPTGEIILGPTDLWRHVRELALGFYYRWDPSAPIDWLIPRRMWGVALRHILGTNHRGLDSELPVKRAVERGEYDGKFVIDNGRKVFEESIDELYSAWKAVEKDFVPNTVPVWLDDSVLRFVMKRMDENPDEIVWTEHVAFAERLAELTGAPYYSRKGVDAKTKRSIMQHDVKKHGAAIASIATCGEGFNLQAWNKGLIVSGPPNGGALEQLLGRMHRDGQEAEEVWYTWLFTSIEQWEGYAAAVEDAVYMQDSTGQAQKLCYADKVMPSHADVAKLSGPLWRR